MRGSLKDRWYQQPPSYTFLPDSGYFSARLLFASILSIVFVQCILVEDLQ